VKGIKLIRGALKSQYKVIGKQFNDILIEGLCRIIVRAVRFYKYELQTIICTILRIVDEIAKELIHVGFEDVSEVDWIVDLCENQHEVLEMSLLVTLVVRMQVIVV
jgi:urease accessory protein UreF